MRLKNIKKIGKDKYKVEVIGMEPLITYDKVILKYNILLKKEIDADLYLKISEENKYYEVYKKVENYILKKMRTEKEVRLYIKKFELATNQEEDIISQLKKEGLLNTKSYIQAFISDKVYLTNMGPNKIKKELIKNGFLEEDIMMYLAPYDKEIFESKLQKLIEKKIKMNKSNSILLLRKKLEKELYDLGYDIPLIKEILSHMSLEDQAILEKEYQKLLTKLSKKYEGYELKSKITQKLYNKGFTGDQIREVVDL